MAMGRTGHELEDEGGSPPGGWDGAGSPKEAGKYGKDSGARGRDPLGAHDKKKGGSYSPKYGNTLALAHLDKLKSSFGKQDRELINEAKELENEYEPEVSSSLSDS